MKAVIHPSYFPSVSHFVALAHSQEWVLEQGDHFQKQTNRNRMYIYSPNGLQLLNIPVKHSIQPHQFIKEVRLETDFDWQKQHLKSLEAAYRSSPYFEYFEDYFAPIYTKKHTFLWDVIMETMAISCKCLGVPFTFTETDEYHRVITDGVDFRSLINGKKDANQWAPYTQVFDDKHGFISNLSIIDLLCNEGRHALQYLKEQPLPVLV
ncbi:MAG: hypothetical protein CFE24_02420 [Flavobacterium sp. BFFFF2]|nr:MAG: hypothetical protein CFE24_02420 [Flavobacterium sp. BFFFF2]